MKSGEVQSTNEENTLSYKYVKRLRNFLWFIGAWPGEVLGEQVPLLIRINRMWHAVQTPAIAFFAIIFLYQHDDINFSQRVYCYIALFIGMLGSVKCSLPVRKQYGELVKRFLMSFHLGHSKHEGDYNAQIFNAVQRISNLFTLYIIIITYTGTILFCVLPLYLSYRTGFFSKSTHENATFHCILCIIIPGVVDTSHFTVPGTIYTAYLAYPCGVSICGIDILLCLMAFQIIGHILILRQNLETLPKPQESASVLKEQNRFLDKVMFFVPMYNNRENEIIHKKLVECVNYHRKILTFVKDLSDFFGPVIGCNYGFELASCCLLLLGCTQGTDDMIRFGPLAAIVFGQLIFISVTFEIIQTVSEKLKDSVYSTPWEYMDTRNRRTVLFMLKRMQNPIHVTAMGLTEVGVTTMASILKTTISYFTLLRSIND